MKGNSLKKYIKLAILGVVASGFMMVLENQARMDLELEHQQRHFLLLIFFKNCI